VTGICRQLACVALRRPVAIVCVESAFNAAFYPGISTRRARGSKQFFYLCVDLTSVHARTECLRAQ
jgi:hypothetical protein